MNRHRTERFAPAVAISIVGLLVSLFAGRAEIAVLTVPWIVLLLAGLVTSRRPRVHLAVEAAYERSTVGESVDVRYIFNATDDVKNGVKGDRLGRFAGTLFASWPDLAGGPTMARAVSSDAPVEVVVPFKADRWGTYNAGRVAVNVVERFGLFSWSADMERDAPIRVHPDELQLRQLIAPTHLGRRMGAHQSTTAAKGMEFAGVRPHASGDSIRDVNWRASARSGDLWVSERHPDRSTDVVLLIDSFPESYGLDVQSVGGPGGLDGQGELLALVVRSAVALAGWYLSLTDRVGMVELGGIVRWIGPAAGKRQLYRIVDAALATTPYRSWARRDLSIVPKRAIPSSAMVVAISPLVDDRFIQAVIELAGGAHDVAIMVLDTPVPAEVADPVRLLWEAERKMTRDRLANHGIATAVLDCEAGEIDAGLQAAMNELERIRR